MEHRKFSLIVAFAFFFWTNSHSEAASGEAQSWTHTDSAGEAFDFPDDLDRPTVILFWATWCPYCKQLMPHLQSLRDEYGSDLEILAISVFEDGDPVAYLDERGYEFRSLIEGDAIAKAYGVRGTPGLFLVDAEGEVLWHLGMAQQEEARIEGVAENWQKASRRAPFWAAELRKAIDTLD